MGHEAEKVFAAGVARSAIMLWVCQAEGDQPFDGDVLAAGQFIDLLELKARAAR